MRMQRLQVRALGRAFYQQDHQLQSSFRKIPQTSQSDYLAEPYSDARIRTVYVYHNIFQKH